MSITVQIQFRMIHPGFITDQDIVDFFGGTFLISIILQKFLMQSRQHTCHLIFLFSCTRQVLIKINRLCSLSGAVWSQNTECKTETNRSNEKIVTIFGTEKKLIQKFRHRCINHSQNSHFQCSENKTTFSCLGGLMALIKTSVSDREHTNHLYIINEWHFP